MQNQMIQEDEIDLRELFATIWKGRVWIAIFVFVITSLTIVYTLSVPNQYTISTTLAPQEESHGANLGSLGSLASLAGVNIGGSSGVTPDVAFQALLSNYAFMHTFIKNRKIDLMVKRGDAHHDYIFALGFDALYRLLHSSAQRDKMTDFEIYKYLKKSIAISSDKKTGMITVSVTLPSREMAMYVLDHFLSDTTHYLINRNITDIDLQISKYKEELRKTENLELKTELAKLVSSLVKQKIYINTSKYYKVKIISKAYIPDVKDKAKPKRALIVIVSFVTSFILAIFILFFVQFIKREGSDV
ncbi:Wzz/FepE/Etk N-terminal domain-containing protein [Sulfurospirillum sp. 1612]|uniref:Wzz/FepE/Etk N-terminal domain-containing protein n=1 Tax=Sulfurospirillum sp. 1612 TaxID=3094835 RepID=UPI002F92B6F5